MKHLEERIEHWIIEPVKLTTSVCGITLKENSL